MAVLATALAACALHAPFASARGCITTLPVTVASTSPYAAAYKRTLDITVSTRGPAITGLQVGLYTFAGDRLAQATLPGRLTGSATISLPMPLGVQAGQYTLYLTGDPNADPSCGPKHASRVLDLRSCITSLPVAFPDRPGGSAADYGHYLSFPVAARGFLIRRLDVAVFSSAKRQLGSVEVPALFGTVTVNVPLRHRLRKGSYSVHVTGEIASQPAACGRATAQTSLSFQ